MNRNQIKGRLRSFMRALEESWGRVIGDQTLQFRGERSRSLGPDPRPATGRCASGR